MVAVIAASWPGRSAAATPPGLDLAAPPMPPITSDVTSNPFGPNDTSYARAMDLQIGQLHGTRRAVAAHAVHAAAGRRRRRAQILPRCPGAVVVPARGRSKECLAKRARAAGDVAAEVIRIVALAVGRRRRNPFEDQIAEARREALHLALDRVGHVDVRSVGHVTVGPQRVPTGRRSRVVGHTRLHDDAKGPLRVTTLRHVLL